MENKIVTSILLIGFHHKKGWQIEYEFPTREKEKSYEDSIPTLSLPDQSHKFQQDTVILNCFYLHYSSSQHFNYF